MNRHFSIALVVLSLCSLGAVNAQCGPQASKAPTIQLGCFGVDYFANNTTAGAPDGTVRINNPGTTNGNLCAMIYVFDNDQEMNECCGCITTPDGLRTLSVKNNLTNNPLTVTTTPKKPAARTPGASSLPAASCWPRPHFSACCC